MKANVIASGACGSTYYIARWLIGRSLGTTSSPKSSPKRLHSFPCTASMERDRGWATTPLHRQRAAQHDSGEGQGNPHPAHPAMSCRRTANGSESRLADRHFEKYPRRAKAVILDECGPTGLTLSTRVRAKAPDLNPAAFVSAVLLLKKGQDCGPSPVHLDNA